MQALFKGILLRHIWVIRKAGTKSPLSTYIHEVLYVLNQQWSICFLQKLSSCWGQGTILQPLIFPTGTSLSFSHSSYLSPLLSLWWGSGALCDMSVACSGADLPEVNYKRGVWFGTFCLKCSKTSERDSDELKYISPALYFSLGHILQTHTVIRTHMHTYTGTNITICPRLGELLVKYIVESETA